jgi:hypothetical protein
MFNFPMSMGHIYPYNVASKYKKKLFTQSKIIITHCEEISCKNFYQRKESTKGLGQG